MPHATPSATLYGDSAGPNTDTETGQLTVDPTDNSFVLSTVVGIIGGNLSFDAADKAPLKAAAEACVAEYDAFGAGSGTGARSWDITDDPADTDPKRLELQENAGTVKLYSGVLHTMKVDTLRGLILAL